MCAHSTNRSSFRSKKDTTRIAELGNLPVLNPTPLAKFLGHPSIQPPLAQGGYGVIAFNVAHTPKTASRLLPPFVLFGYVPKFGLFSGPVRLPLFSGPSRPPWVSRKRQNLLGICPG